MNATDLLFSGGLMYLLAFLLGTLVVRSIARRYFSALATVPGPFTASITRAWRIKEVYAGNVEETELRLHEVHGMQLLTLCYIMGSDDIKIGPLVRTGPNEVVTNDPKAIELLYGFSSKFEKVLYILSNVQSAMDL
jgi:hypothetical protein